MRFCRGAASYIGGSERQIRPIRGNISGAVLSDVGTERHHMPGTGFLACAGFLARAGLDLRDQPADAGLRSPESIAELGRPSERPGIIQFAHNLLQLLGQNAKVAPPVASRTAQQAGPDDAVKRAQFTGFSLIAEIGMRPEPPVTMRAICQQLTAARENAERPREEVSSNSAASARALNTVLRNRRSRNTSASTWRFPPLFFIHKPLAIAPRESFIGAMCAFSSIRGARSVGLIGIDCGQTRIGRIMSNRRAPMRCAAADLTAQRPQQAARDDVALHFAGARPRYARCAHRARCVPEAGRS